MKKIIKHRIYYFDTDQMGVVYHANYLKWLEIARTEFFRSSIPYSKLEEMNILLPISDLTIKYIDSVYYDEEIYIHIELKILTKVKVVFDYFIYDAQNKLKAKANTINVFTNKEGKIIRLSDELFYKLKNI